MNQATLSMLDRYQCLTTQDYENALNEIVQEIALLGLWRSKFFEHAAFYGGTALRILHGLDRFSEDLAFSLLQPQNNFTIGPYLNAVQAELEAMGFSVSVEERNKLRDTAIESAFVKAGTKEHLIKVSASGGIANSIQRNELLSIKLEIDNDPPAGFATEAKTLLQPIPFSVKTYTLPDLFAGKLQSILQLNWQTRIKGRDYYDFAWYISRAVPVHLSHLEQRLRQSGGWSGSKALSECDLQRLLNEKLSQLDVAAAKKDVSPFLRDQSSITLWSNDFFKSLISLIVVN